MGRIVDRWRRGARAVAGRLVDRLGWTRHPRDAAPDGPRPGIRWAAEDRLAALEDHVRDVVAFNNDRFGRIEDRVRELQNPREGFDAALSLIEHRIDGIYGNLLNRPEFVAALSAGERSFPDRLFREVESLERTFETEWEADGGFRVADGDQKAYLIRHYRRLKTVFQVLASLRDERRLGSLLDVGTSAIYHDVLRGLLPGAELHFIGGGEPKSDREHFAELNVETDPYPIGDASIDVVTLLEVIEHLFRDPMFCLAEINRVLRPGGTLILTTPNVVCWRSVAAVLTGYPPASYSKYNPFDPVSPNHVKEYTPGEVAALLGHAGFKADVFTMNMYSDRESPMVMDLLETLSLPRQDRGDCIVAIAVKASGILERYPAGFYDVPERLRSRS